MRAPPRHDVTVLLALLAGMLMGMLLACCTGGTDLLVRDAQPTHTLSAPAAATTEHPQAKVLDDGTPSLYDPENDSLSMAVANVTASHPHREVLVAVANSNLLSADGSRGMLRTWLEQVWSANVPNYLVVAIDDQVAHALHGLGVPFWRRGTKQLAATATDNHGISAQKFDILHDFLKRDISVLLCDVDVVVLKNPFNGHLYRDSDVEGMSDGFDAGTAYGHIDGVDDPSMGWSRYAQAMRIFVTNSGLFYLRPNNRTRELVRRCTERLMMKKDWDQSVFNEEMFYPSHGSYITTGITKRVMDINDFMNSKYLFKTVRYSPNLRSHVPVMVHLNYHPEKWERMRAVIRYFHDDDPRALSAWPDGSK